MELGFKGSSVEGIFVGYEEQSSKPCPPPLLLGSSLSHQCPEAANICKWTFEPPPPLHPLSVFLAFIKVLPRKGGSHCNSGLSKSSLARSHSPASSSLPGTKRQAFSTKTLTSGLSHTHTGRSMCSTQEMHWQSSPTPRDPLLN